MACCPCHRTASSQTQRTAARQQANRQSKKMKIIPVVSSMLKVNQLFQLLQVYSIASMFPPLSSCKFATCKARHWLKCRHYFYQKSALASFKLARTKKSEASFSSHRRNTPHLGKNLSAICLKASCLPILHYSSSQHP